MNTKAETGWNMLPPLLSFSVLPVSTETGINPNFCVDIGDG